jgi:hypothetical protein
MKGKTGDYLPLMYFNTSSNVSQYLPHKARAPLSMILPPAIPMAVYPANRMEQTPAPRKYVHGSDTASRN